MGAGIWNRGNVLVGLYGMWKDGPAPQKSYSGTRSDLGSVLSNDGIHFREPVPNFKVVERGAEGEWDSSGQFPQEWFGLASRLRWRDADGIFLSGHVGFVEQLEEHTGKPVVASSPGTTWMMLRTAGVQDSIEGAGSLLRPDLLSKPTAGCSWRDTSIYEPLMLC